MQRLARARRRRRANGVQKLGDSCSGTGDARRRSRWRAFSVGERYPATHGFPRWFPMHGGAIFWPAKGVNNSDRLAETYTEPYTVGPLEGWNSQENQVVTINRKALKSPRGIRRNTMFPPALKGWNHPAPPVPRPRACPPPHPSRSRRAPTAPLKLSCLKPYTSGVSSALDARAWRNGRRSGLEGNLSARWETGDAELPKFGEPCHMAIPSQARPEPSSREGVETRRAAPNPGSAGHGEGIVQTANPASAPGRRKP